AAPWGDPEDVGRAGFETLGNMFGPEPVDPFGTGLGVFGKWRGGGGHSRSIGLGAIAIVGHGSRASADQGSGMIDASPFVRDASLGSHEARAPSLSTRVAPSVVLRVMQQAAPRLASCVREHDVDLSFDVMPDGAASRVMVENGNNGCLARVLS